MAHYACDCWDAEIDFSQGWKECVGLANRSAFDLEKHTEHSKVNLFASRKLPVPLKVNVVEITINKKELNNALKADGTELTKHIDSLNEESKAEL